MTDITKMFARIDYMSNVLMEVAKGYAPKHLISAIRVTTEIDGGTAIIRLYADRNANPLQKWGSLDARAQEFGSGLQATKGKKDFIPIIPVNATWLVFPGTHEWEGQVIRIKRVRHPGTPMYQGRGYLKVAVTEFKKYVIPMIDPDIRKEIHLVIRQSFGGRVK